ncbi:FGGY-family carbohydrate kinase [Neobacillus sp. 19]|uniref:FGGY-family carbohydrate kinase n=1 Tax=Neobacillus sp. 19 TaxID=3394458 RepID=UPI003BF6E1D7
MKEIVMGIDAGTEGVRVGLFDLQGNEITFASTEYKTYHPHPGWAEQDPNDWWSALAKSSRKALADSGIDKKQIIGVSYDATCCSVIACKDDGTPIRNPLIWMDIRANKQAKFIAEKKHPILKMSGYDTVSAEWMPCKALWLKQNEPENYDNADKIVEFVDWYTYMLTGSWTVSTCNATTRWYYNRDEGGWPYDFYEGIGLGDIFEKFPKHILDLGEFVGGLTKAAADDLGLEPGTPVAQGGADAFVGLIGLGVVESGKLGLITGSSHLLMGLTEQNFNGKGIFGGFPDAVIKGLKMVEGGQISTGSVIKWFINNFCQDLVQKSQELNQNVFDFLTPEASKLPPGSDGLLVLEYWQGNRTPYVDPDVRGLMYGFSLNHRREHIYRALMEGIAFGTDLVINSFKKNGFNATELYVAGGASNSDLFLQIHSDVSNLPIYVPKVTQAPSLGSAILASVAAKRYSSIPEAVSHMVHYKKKVEPNFENHLKYKQLSQRYNEAYPILQPWMKGITETVQI